MFKEKNYEVIKFIEHNRKCHIVMDCATGMLLIHRLDNCCNLTKDTVFHWFKMLALELEKYHRYRNERCYRHLNPYSILLTSENKVMLLDLNAQSNTFVMKSMQKPVIREHFVKPVLHIKENGRLSPDIYCLGKTMQFVLARSESMLSLTKREIYVLSVIIEKCLGENPRKKYDSLKQIQKDLPRSMPKKHGLALIRKIWGKSS